MSPEVLWRRQRGDCCAQDISFRWQPVVWAGQVCLVRVGEYIYTLTQTQTHTFNCLSANHLTLTDCYPVRRSYPAFLSYVLECSSCGVIYRSRQYWLGNQDPESSVVRSEVKHVWEGVSAPACLSFSAFYYYSLFLHTFILFKFEYFLWIIRHTFT